MDIGHCHINGNGADFCCCITFPDRQWTSILTQVTSLAGLATWVRLSAVNVLGFHLLSDSSIWQKHPFPKARACHILASTDVFHNGKCAMLRAGKAEIWLGKCVCLTCWVLFIHVASPALTHMFSHCRGWRQLCEILLTALKLHALTWNQDSAYICVLLYLLTWAFKTIQKPMKLLAENQFPRCSTVSLTVLLSTWDNNRFYLIILFYLIRVEGENQFPGWTPVATWDTWTLISVWSSSPGVIRPDLINAWLIHTFHILNRRLSQCSVSCFY